MHINDIAKKVFSNAEEKGFHPAGESEDTFVERLCNNMHNEVSELHEAWRKNMLHQPCDKAEKMREMGINPLTCLEEELADILIRALDNCAKFGLDPEAIIMTKHAYNKTRSFRHGGKRS